MIFVLSGAGLSAESGLGTFRGPGGLWENHDPMDLATPEAFARDPALVHRFYNARREAARAAEPNPAHRALARLQRARETMLVTQNVDDLLERAGARDVIHMHGRLAAASCARCDAGWEVDGAMAPDDPCPACGAAATRPDVVWFGEMPRHLDAIEAGLSRATLFVAVGTSGTVYPAAGFVAAARGMGIPTLELNLEASGARFDDSRIGPAGTVVPAWVESVLGRGA